MTISRDVPRARRFDASHRHRIDANAFARTTATRAHAPRDRDIYIYTYIYGCESRIQRPKRRSTISSEVFTRHVVRDHPHTERTSSVVCSTHTPFNVAFIVWRIQRAVATNASSRTASVTSSAPRRASTRVVARDDPRRDSLKSSGKTLGNRNMYSLYYIMYSHVFPLTYSHVFPLTYSYSNSNVLCSVTTRHERDVRAVARCVSKLIRSS